MTSTEAPPTPDSPAPESPIETLEQALGVRWDAIRKARAKTDELVTKLKAALSELEDPSCAVVVTGSLGRGEASGDSDADWVLLVDGPSDPDHAQLAREVEQRICKVVPKKPGPTGTFGDIVPSHGLVHYIAGTRDTNENLTRRILLLSESRALTGQVIRERAIRNVLARYVLHDRSVRNQAKAYHAIPHFLLNDVVRYWRTMASDYASKMWERSRKEWGTRNIKLRFSRKLLFVWGLVASFSGVLFQSEALRGATNEDEFFRLLADLIREQTEVTPLELLARILCHPDVKPETAKTIFSTYDTFLAALSDPATRKHLDDVPFEKAADDEIYDGLRKASNEFSNGLKDVFFDQHPTLKMLIRQYGVF